VRTKCCVGLPSKWESRIGVGHNPWAAFGESRQLTLMIFGRSVHFFESKVNGTETPSLNVTYHPQEGIQLQRQ